MSYRAYDERHYSVLYERYEPAWSRTALLDDLEYLPCYYCGDPWEEQDHAFPISQVGSYNIDEIRHRLLIVPACKECNRIAGAIPDASLDDRKDRVQWSLRKRYKSLLAAPNHTPAELATLSGRLRQEITRRQHKRLWLSERLRF